MFQGKISAAFQLLTQQGKGGVLHVHDPVDASVPDSHTILDILKSKHPQAQLAFTDSVPLPFTDFPEIHSVVFDCINASSIRSAALHTKGSAGPSSIDAHCWRRLCTSFKTASEDLCHSLVQVARRLCTSFVDPRGPSALLACHLIASLPWTSVLALDLSRSARLPGE